MTLLYPSALLLLLLVMLIIWQRRRLAIAQTWQSVWLIVALISVAIALTRPVIEQVPIELPRSGGDTILAIDLSYSMQATDIKPNRLSSAKQIIHDLVLANPYERFGVIGFTTNAIILSPMTTDGELLLHLVNGLDEQMIMTKGTDIMSALVLARKMSVAKVLNVLLFTDGGDAVSYLKEANYAKEHGLKVSVVLLASAQGSTLTQPDGRLLKDEAGHLVVTSQNRVVQHIADATGGRVIEGSDLAAIQKSMDSDDTADTERTFSVMTYQELFMVPLIIALISAMLAFITLGRFKQMLPLLALLLVSPRVEAAMLDSWYLYLGDKAYAKGAYLEAASAYEKINTPQARFNAANSLYYAGEYEAALQQYEALKPTTIAWRAAVWFNMANCYIRLKQFDQARQKLQQSLSLVPDPDALENLYAIAEAEAQQMMTGKQQGKKRAEGVERKSSDQQQKREGGGSNMAENAQAGNSGGGDKVASTPQLSVTTSKSGLSSRQYELINQRSVHESKPW
jgi:Ca-activated chloride channel family protein